MGSAPMDPDRYWKRDVDRRLTKAERRANHARQNLQGIIPWKQTTNVLLGEMDGDIAWLKDRVERLERALDRYIHMDDRAMGDRTPVSETSSSDQHESSHAPVTPQFKAGSTRTRVEGGGRRPRKGMGTEGSIDGRSA